MKIESTLYPFGDTTPLSTCSMVYEPAEDTWLALEAIRDIIREGEPRGGLCVDVGTGTGVLGLFCARKGYYTVLVDLNPCATACAQYNMRSLGALGDIVQCSTTSCLRCPLAVSLLVYNTPYLPVEEKGLEGLAWSGGLEEAHRLIEYYLNCVPSGCSIVVYSSLSGSDRELLRKLKKAGRLVLRSLHVFFEDIKAAATCK